MQLYAEDSERKHDFEPRPVLRQSEMSNMEKPKIFLITRKECSILDLTFDFVRFFERSASVSALYRALRLLVISLALGAAVRIASF